MESVHMSLSNWDGQLPPHIAKSEQIWLELLSEMRLKCSTPKISKFLGRIKESPSLWLLSKVFFIVDTKENLGLPIRSILNDWGCYCQCEPVDVIISNKRYAAGIETIPYLIFDIFPNFLSGLLFERFGGLIHQHSLPDKLWEEAKESLTNNKIEVLKYTPGSWLKGLEISFKASIWLATNKEEALKEIWKLNL